MRKPAREELGWKKEQHVRRPEDVNRLGAFKDRKKAVGEEGRTRVGRARSQRP